MSRIFAGLGVFLIIDGILYGFFSGDYDGLTLIVITAGGALLIGSFLVQGVQHARASLAAHPEGVGDDEPHVEPTIWPLVFALSTIGLVVGALTAPWVVGVGGAVLIASLAGWSLDVRRQWQHHHTAAAHAQPGPPLPHHPGGEAG
ncbi:MAG TPA: cytochrome c oxidase subunit 4 [Nocardioidaceae bacterium]|nr:cytochrome c oxidase subunit 4 [Nocardioidaceae bacterium]